MKFIKTKKMTREQIERAARIERENVHKELQENYRKHKDINLYTAFSATIDMYAVPLFKAGAQWRINSVWHNLPNDLPQKENTWILLELIFEGRLVYLPVEWVNDGEGAPKQAIRWAYIDDLLPERKEETK